jgi:hypothetical protein
MWRSAKFCFYRNLSNILCPRLKRIMTLSEIATGEGHGDICELLLFYIKWRCLVIYRGYLPLNDPTEFIYWNGKHCRAGKKKVIQLKYHRSDWAFYERRKQITSDPILTLNVWCYSDTGFRLRIQLGLPLRYFCCFPQLIHVEYGTLWFTSLFRDMCLLKYSKCYIKI